MKRNVNVYLIRYTKGKRAGSYGFMEMINDGVSQLFDHDFNEVDLFEGAPERAGEPGNLVAAEIVREVKVSFISDTFWELAEDVVECGLLADDEDEDGGGWVLSLKLASNNQTQQGVRLQSPLPQPNRQGDIMRQIRDCGCSGQCPHRGSRLRLAPRNKAEAQARFTEADRKAMDASLEYALEMVKRDEFLDMADKRNAPSRKADRERLGRLNREAMLRDLAKLNHACQLCGQCVEASARVAHLEAEHRAAGDVEVLLDALFTYIPA